MRRDIHGERNDQPCTATVQLEVAAAVRQTKTLQGFPVPAREVNSSKIR